MLTRLSFTRNEVTLTADRPLTEAQIEACKAHCAAFERAVEAPAKRAIASST